MGVFLLPGTFLIVYFLQKNVCTSVYRQVRRRRPNHPAHCSPQLQSRIYFDNSVSVQRPEITWNIVIISINPWLQLRWTVCRSLCPDCYFLTTWLQYSVCDVYRGSVCTSGLSCSLMISLISLGSLDLLSSTVTVADENIPRWGTDSEFYSCSILTLWRIKWHTPLPLVKYGLFNSVGNRWDNVHK